MNHLPRISILAPTLNPYDAIGTDVARMRQILLARGYPVRVFSDAIHPRCATIAEPLSRSAAKSLQSPQDILIYHHSTGWELGLEILSRTASHVIVRYHNITPPQFFYGYSPAFQGACTAGLEATAQIARLPGVTVLADSTFNCDQMIALGIPAASCRVLPPLHATEELAQEPFDLPTVRSFAGEVVNILFVGGIKPNKGHFRAIRVFAEYYHRFNNRARLIFAGGIDDRLLAYLDDLRRLAAYLGVGNDVIFTGSVSASQLKSLYVAADVFLCTSEHEGFCVPLVEAMYFRVPVVTWARTAVPETMAGCGFVLDEWDEAQFASCIAELVNDPALAVRFGELGRKRYRSAFSAATLELALSDNIAEAVARLGGRPLPIESHPQLNA